MPAASLNQIAAFFFSIDGRVGRGEYVLGILFLLALNIAVVLFLTGQTAGQMAMSTMMIVGLLFAPSQFIIAIKRCHDLGLPGLFVLLFLVPIFGVLWLIALAVIPGSPDANRYGPAPQFHPE